MFLFVRSRMTEKVLFSTYLFDASVKAAYRASIRPLELVKFYEFVTVSRAMILLLYIFDTPIGLVSAEDFSMASREKPSSPLSRSLVS